MKKLIFLTGLFMLPAGAMAQHVAQADSVAKKVEQVDSVAKKVELDEVVVKGEKPRIKEENGIWVVDLPGIVRDKPVNNILEALGYMPGVVNNNGMIGLAGASSVTIILNGEPTDMPLQNLYQLLYTTPVDRLEHVEIMYSAPAKYHADGAVINVVLKTPKPLDGLQGQVRAGYNQAHYGSYGGTLAATYAVKDWAFDLNYGLSRSKSWSHEQSFSNHLLDGTRTMIEEDMPRAGRNWASTIYAAAAWKTVKLTYNGQIVSGSETAARSTGTLGNFTNAYDYESPINYHNLALRYEAPFGMTVGGGYSRYYEKREQSLFRDSALLTGSTNRQAINIYRLYVDQEHRLGEWKLTYGAEYQRSVDHSSQKYRTAGTEDFDNTLDEDVASVYAGTERSFGQGLSFNASAKVEYYHNDYQDNWNFMPQLDATYYKTPGSIFQLNLGIRRIYPSYWELHGGTKYNNSYSAVKGNPALAPYIDYSVQLNYIFRQKYMATLYFQYGDKASVQLPYQSPDALELVYQTINMDFKRTAGLNLYAPFHAGYVWNATATANVFNQREKAGHFHDIAFDNSKWVFYGMLGNSFKFSPDCPVSLTVDLSYISPSVQGIACLSGMWKADAGAKWLFGKKSCCELDLKADDLFNRWSPTMTINHAGQDYRMKTFDMTRNFRLIFIWRFNGFKPKDNSIDTSRFGTGK